MKIVDNTNKRLRMFKVGMVIKSEPGGFYLVIEVLNRGYTLLELDTNETTAIYKTLEELSISSFESTDIILSAHVIIEGEA